jgi:hypothetical protein
VDGKYGGVMIWQLAQDATGPQSLLATIDQVINNIAHANGLTESIELYPHPVDSVINLRTLGFEYREVSIVDESGKSYSAERTKDGILDVSMLSPGLYILRLTNSRGSLTKKFLKK